MKNLLRIHIYKARDGGWRWRMLRCGRIIADSGESYGRRYDCGKALRNMLAAVRKQAFTID